MAIAISPEDQAKDQETFWRLQEEADALHGAVESIRRRHEEDWRSYSERVEDYQRRFNAFFARRSNDLFQLHRPGSEPSGTLTGMRFAREEKGRWPMRRTTESGIPDPSDLWLRHATNRLT